MHKNTHLQTAQSHHATQSLQESIFFPNPTVIKNKKSPFPQKSKTYYTDSQRYTDSEKEALGGNSGFAKKRVQWLIEHSTSHQILWYVDSLVIRNPLLRKAAKRYMLLVPK